ncbi:hypothetical protein KBTX_01195 [wastewater metagenome]|uniref:Uncharacterized protein n=2 Tax=unclassified sequences TaxID=12908 RepID=A0A5B8RAB1_9ZZZZ|nr:hypothetical protein KBTEX_01195 [uncultured organism]
MRVHAGEHVAIDLHAVGAGVLGILVGDLQGDVVGPDQVADSVGDVLRGLAVEVRTGAGAGEQAAAVIGVELDVAHAAHLRVAGERDQVGLIGDGVRHRVRLHRERGLVPQLGAGGEIEQPLSAVGIASGIDGGVAPGLRARAARDIHPVGDRRLRAALALCRASTAVRLDVRAGIQIGGGIGREHEVADRLQGRVADGDAGHRTVHVHQGLRLRDGDRPAGIQLHPLIGLHVVDGLQHQAVTGLAPVAVDVQDGVVADGDIGVRRDMAVRLYRRGVDHAAGARGDVVVGILGPADVGLRGHLGGTGGQVGAAGDRRIDVGSDVVIRAGTARPDHGGLHAVHPAVVARGVVGTHAQRVADQGIVGDARRHAGPGHGLVVGFHLGGGPRDHAAAAGGGAAGGVVLADRPDLERTDTAVLAGGPVEDGLGGDAVRGVGEIGARGHDTDGVAGGLAVLAGGGARRHRDVGARQGHIPHLGADLAGARRRGLGGVHADQAARGGAAGEGAGIDGARPRTGGVGGKAAVQAVVRDVGIVGVRRAAARRDIQGVRPDVGVVLDHGNRTGARRRLGNGCRRREVAAERDAEGIRRHAGARGGVDGDAAGDVHGGARPDPRVRGDLVRRHHAGAGGTGEETAGTGPSSGAGNGVGRRAEADVAEPGHRAVGVQEGVHGAVAFRAGIDGGDADPAGERRAVGTGGDAGAVACDHVEVTAVAGDRAVAHPGGHGVVEPRVGDVHRDTAEAADRAHVGMQQRGVIVAEVVGVRLHGDPVTGDRAVIDLGGDLAVDPGETDAHADAHGAADTQRTRDVLRGGRIGRGHGDVAAGVHVAGDDPRGRLVGAAVAVPAAGVIGGAVLQRGPGIAGTAGAVVVREGIRGRGLELGVRVGIGLERVVVLAGGIAGLPAAGQAVDLRERAAAALVQLLVRAAVVLAVTGHGAVAEDDDARRTRQPHVHAGAAGHGGEEQVGVAARIHVDVAAGEDIGTVDLGARATLHQDHAGARPGTGTPADLDTQRARHRVQGHVVAGVHIKAAHRVAVCPDRGVLDGGLRGIAYVAEGAGARDRAAGGQ